MRIKKGIALLLASCLTLGLMGCSNKKTQETPPSESGDINLITNGSFDENIDGFGLYEEQGSGKILWNEERQCLECEITNVGDVAHGVQVYVDGFSLTEGVIYEFSFDVYATMEREIDWRFQINGSDYHAYATASQAVTEIITNVTVEFAMKETSDPAPRLCFNMGYTDAFKNNNVNKMDIPKHSVYLDNLSLKVKNDDNAVKNTSNVKLSKIRVNQVGYETNARKYAVFADLDSSDKKYSLIDIASGKTVKSGDIPKLEENKWTGESNAMLDFSDVKTPGTYKFVTAEGEESATFAIGDDVYKESYDALLRMLYLQRCGVELTKEEAGDFAHKRCHTQLATIYGTTTEIDVSGGWHDAGDYGRYVVSGVKAVADLFIAYDETGNEVLLEEARYELDWLFKMQDAATGGVYHKVTGELFPGTILPEDETWPLIVCPVSNTATGDFAAIMAKASRLYKDEAFSSKCLEASKKAYDYLILHQKDNGFTNPGTIVTGEYPDSDCNDEIFWSAIVLYVATGDESYFKEVEEIYDKLTGLIDLGWVNMAGYGMYTMLSDRFPSGHTTFVNTVKTEYIRQVDYTLPMADASPYNISRSSSFEWGSNMGIANLGITYLIANKATGDSKYKTYANSCLNYLYGINATGYCFITGFGTLSPQHTHHRPSQKLNKTMPGMLVGGVNSGLDDPYAKAVLTKAAKAKCYVDNDQSYSCNEVCVYWNSPLIALLNLEK